MTSSFAPFIPQARAFLAQLTQNNDRDWFTAHKAQYETELKTPALMFLDQIAHDLGKQTGDDIDTKLFRPYRDVRFSKDKTPYTTHLHMLWLRRTGGPQYIGYFFGIAPDYVQAGAGLMKFEKPMILRWRAAVDGPVGDQIKTIVTDAVRAGAAMREPGLKRVPAPYPSDHRHGDLLRRQGIALWKDLDPKDFDDPAKALHAAFDQIAPLTRVLRTLV
jgi:uncharacterized protein (TIGR02453 family)